MVYISNVAHGEVPCAVTQHVHACMQEFCNGGALRTLLQRGALSARRLPQRFRRVLGLAVGIARGMEFITARGILHGDLNPSNILLQVRAAHCSTPPTRYCVRPLQLWVVPDFPSIACIGLVASGSRTDRETTNIQDYFLSFTLITGSTASRPMVQELCPVLPSRGFSGCLFGRGPDRPAPENTIFLLSACSQSKRGAAVRQQQAHVRRGSAGGGHRNRQDHGLWALPAAGRQPDAREQHQAGHALLYRARGSGAAAAAPRK